MRTWAALDPLDGVSSVLLVASDADGRGALQRIVAAHQFRVLSPPLVSLALGRVKYADLVLIDAPLGGTQDTALAALRHGDPVAVGAVFSDGIPRFVGRSRNTPAPTRTIRVAENHLPRDFSGAAH